MLKAAGVDTVSAGGLVRPPLLVLLSVPEEPALSGVNVNVSAAVDPAGIVTVDGENVPASVLASVIVIALAAAEPAPGVTVNVLALPAVREDGPVSV